MWDGLLHSVIVLQLSDLSLMAVDFTLQAFNLFFVVVNFLLMMLLQCSQLLLLLASIVHINTMERLFLKMKCKDTTGQSPVCLV